MCARAPSPKIETERLVLRAPGLEDAVYIADLANDAEVARMTTGVSFPYRLADAQRYLTTLVERGPDRAAVFLIEHREVGPIGIVGLYRGKDLCPELGFWLGRSFRGRGFATEAVQGALGWAARDWGCRAALAGHFVDNPSSARVLDKAGFLYTGDVRRRFSYGRQQEVPTRIMAWLA
jgi:RimJ/RimL family protein N-acetyltransferase